MRWTHHPTHMHSCFKFKEQQQQQGTRSKKKTKTKKGVSKTNVFNHLSQTQNKQLADRLRSDRLLVSTLFILLFSSLLFSYLAYAAKVVDAFGKDWDACREEVGAPPEVAVAHTLDLQGEAGCLRHPRHPRHPHQTTPFASPSPPPSLASSGTASLPCESHSSCASE